MDAPRRSGCLWPLAVAAGIVALNGLLASALLAVLVAYQSTRETPGGGCEKGGLGPALAPLVFLLVTIVTPIVAFRAARATRTDVVATVGLTILLLLPLAFFEFLFVVVISVCGD